MGGQSIAWHCMALGMKCYMLLSQWTADMVHSLQMQGMEAHMP